MTSAITLELGTGDMRIAAGDRTGTVVGVRPGNAADESDGKAAEQVSVDYAGGMLRVTGPRPGAFDSSRKTTVIINQSRPVAAATGLRRLASAIGRADGEDTGSEGASR